MWRIEDNVGDAGAPYDRRAAVYDRLVRSRIYNRLAWSTSPGDYVTFAARAIASADGPVLEVAAGSASATAPLHAHTQRPTTLVDLSRPMLERAASSIATAGADGPHQVSTHIRLVHADLFDLPFREHGFATVMGLGLTHLFDDLEPLVSALCKQLAPGGELYLAGLVAQTRRGRRYLALLERAGEVARPRTAKELHTALGRPSTFWTAGCMAYARIPNPVTPSAHPV